MHPATCTIHMGSLAEWPGRWQTALFSLFINCAICLFSWKQCVKDFIRHLRLSLDSVTRVTTKKNIFGRDSISTQVKEKSRFLLVTKGRFLLLQTCHNVVFAILLHIYMHHKSCVPQAAMCLPRVSSFRNKGQSQLVICTLFLNFKHWRLNEHELWRVRIFTQKLRVRLRTNQIEQSGRIRASPKSVSKLRTTRDFRTKRQCAVKICRCFHN